MLVLSSGNGVISTKNRRKTFVVVEQIFKTLKNVVSDNMEYNTQPASKVPEFKLNYRISYCSNDEGVCFIITDKNLLSRKCAGPESFSMNFQTLQFYKFKNKNGNIAGKFEKLLQIFCARLPTGFADRSHPIRSFDE